MYKEASKLKLRFNTDRGLISVENLWNLDIQDLDNLAINLEKEYKQSGKKSFVIKKTKKDKIAKLKFDIVLDILTTKVEERDQLQKSAEIKEHNEKILSLISEKQEEELKGKSLKELKSLLK